MTHTKSANKFDIYDNEKITMEYFDSESDVEEETNIRYTMYYYSHYRIAEKKYEIEIGDLTTEYRLVLTSDTVEEFPIKVKTLDDALSIINIIEGR